MAHEQRSMTSVADYDITVFATTARSHNSHNIPVRVGSSQMVLIFFSKTFEKGCRLFSICVFKLSIPICFSKFEKFL